MKYCLIGEKLGHSYSKVIHEKFNINYDLVEIEKDKLSDFFKDCKYSGFNVTIPYKKDVILYMSYLSPVAKLAGAVNTVVNKNGKFYGYNTDVDGMNYMIKRAGLTLKGKNVMILGSGGTSNTANTLAKRENAKSITIVSRNGLVNYENCYDYANTEIIINTTPVGMFPNPYSKPINLSRFKNLQGVFDCIYNPKNTELLQDAKLLNIPCEGGLSMLVEQALLARDSW
ncbi:MAG: shikimate dehydrogenase, partial [Clostridia bacterium]|nr:shikimate dehydrogenase [Clostridia bacterium]